jgi:hypothetical protein
MVSAWLEPPSGIPAEPSVAALTERTSGERHEGLGRQGRHSNQSLGLERRCHTVTLGGCYAHPRARR